MERHRCHSVVIPALVRKGTQHSFRPEGHGSARRPPHIPFASSRRILWQGEGLWNTPSTPLAADDSRKCPSISPCSAQPLRPSLSGIGHQSFRALEAWLIASLVFFIVKLLTKEPLGILWQNVQAPRVKGLQFFDHLLWQRRKGNIEPGCGSIISKKARFPGTSQWLAGLPNDGVTCLI